MAFIGNKILLGYEEEPVTEKYCDHIDFKTSKIGGKPNWVCNPSSQVNCKLCGLASPLVLQIYAPMVNSPYHRTLYIFACINPNCWNKNDSWVCLRSQKVETQSNERPFEEANEVPAEPPSYWCGGSDAWGDDQENGNTLDFLNNMSQNSNEINQGFAQNVSDLNRGFSQMSVDERNANVSNGSPTAEGATGVVPTAVAMIEADEGEVVCVDTPTAPQDNLAALLEQAMALPSVPDSRFEFSSFFISVDEEDLSRVGLSEQDAIMSKLRTYRANQDTDDDMTCSGEGYEKSLPPHGDKMFHRFLTRIHANPGHIIRYGGYPLWLYPAEKSHYSCRYCGGESAFEMQILPTLIPKLFINGSVGHLEFGSVFIYSCLAGCWDQLQPNPRFETLIVQREKM